MITANELRIGNIVEKKEVEYVADFITIQMAHNYNPIPLTPEILEKAGFKRDGAYYSHRNLNLPVSPTFTGEEMIVVPNRKYALELKYVHQLQNLYHALTGKELQIIL